MEQVTISDTRGEQLTGPIGIAGEMAGVAGENDSAVAKIMRYVGLGLVGLGALTLLAEGAKRIDPVERFFSFSLIISLSALLGVYLASWRRDHKNGRALVAVFLACVPVFWAQLGGVSYAGFQGVAEQVPVWFRMPAVSLTTVGVALLLAAVAVVPLTAFAARIFAVGFERHSTLLLCTMGIALAIPLRTGLTATVILLGLVMTIVIYERRLLPAGALRYTGDALFVRAILLSLPLIAALRSLNYAAYTYGGFAEAACIIVSGSVLAWCWDLVRRRHDGVSTFLSDLSIAVATLPLVSATLYALGYLSHPPYMLLLPGCYLLAGERREKELVATRTTIAHYLLLIAVLLNPPDLMVLDPIFKVGVPVAIAWYSVQQRYLVRLLLSTAVVLFNTEQFLRALLNTIVEYRWSSLMVAGIALIFGASYVERGARRAIQYWQAPRVSTANS